MKPLSFSCRAGYYKQSNNFSFVGEIAKPVEKAPKWLLAHFNFCGSVSTSSGHFVPKFGVGRGTEAFIYALSADETSPALAAPRHTITALFSCCFKCACPTRRQPHFRSNADRAYNTLHFASKVVCQRDTLWKPFFVGVCSHTSSKMQNKRSQSAVKPQSD